jgi:hypothetical protein
MVLLLAACAPDPTDTGKPAATDSDADTDTDSDTDSDSATCESAGTGDVVLVHWTGDLLDGGAWPRAAAGDVFGAALFPDERVDILDPTDCYMGLLGCASAWPAVGEWVGGDARDYERASVQQIAFSPKLDMGAKVTVGAVELVPNALGSSDQVWATDHGYPAWVGGTPVGLGFDADSVVGERTGADDLVLPTLLEVTSSLPDDPLGPDTILPLRWTPATDGEVYLMAYWAVEVVEGLEYDFVWTMTRLDDDGAYDLDLAVFAIADLFATHSVDSGSLQLGLFRQAGVTLDVGGYPVRLAARSEHWSVGTIQLPPEAE